MVARSIPESRSAFRRVAERPVEAGGELRRVGQDAGGWEPALVEGAPDLPDLSVHHAGGRHQVGPGVGLNQRDPAVQGEGPVVVHRAVVGQDPAVAVVGVLVQAEVGDQHVVVPELAPHRL